jgi:cytochrome c oxidase subunit 2
MIENKLATVPACQTGKNAGEQREQKTVRQDGRRVCEAQSPIRPGNGQKRYCSNGVRPACNADADALYEQQFCGADQSGTDPRGERKAGRPDADAHPERISAPPIENIDAEGADDQRYRKVDAHRMDRVSGNRNCGCRFFLGHFFDNRISAITRLVHKTSLSMPRTCKPGIGFPALMIGPYAAKGTSLSLKFGLLFSLTFLSACSGDLSAVDPAGPSAQSIATLWWVMLWGAIAIFVPVLALILLAVFRPGFASNIPAKNWIVWGGLVLPTVVLTALVTFALFQGERLLAKPLATMPLKVAVDARQWAWDFSYPDADIDGVTNVLHIPAGQPVDILVTSSDVIHSFWVPRLGGKIDAIPGHTNTIRLQADRPGTYHGVCAEFCGTGHSEMPFTVIAHALENYDAALRQSIETEGANGG